MIKMLEFFSSDYFIPILLTLLFLIIFFDLVLSIISYRRSIKLINIIREKLNRCPFPPLSDEDLRRNLEFAFKQSEEWLGGSEGHLNTSIGIESFRKYQDKNRET